MTFEEYTKGVLRTAAHGSVPDSTQVCIRALGLVGEIGEFVESEDAEEAGDVLWYVAALAHAFDIRLEFGVASPMFPAFARRNLLLAATKTAEAVKKTIGHNKRRVTVIEVNLQHVLECLSTLCEKPIEEIAADNLAKLRERYPDGFKVSP